VKQALDRAEALAKEEDDADHWYWLAKLRLIAGASEEAIEATQHLLDRDPSFVDALRWRARAFIGLNRVDDARRALEECVRQSPSGTSCLKLLVGVYENEGECALAEELDRRLIASDPSNPDWYVRLADTLYAQHRGLDAVRTALEHSFSLRSGKDRLVAEARDGARLAELEGRFDVAESLFQRWRDTRTASCTSRARSVAPSSSVIGRNGSKP
jgi:tetratricopeptide (TPR) repeat protein